MSQRCLMERRWQWKWKSRFISNLETNAWADQSERGLRVAIQFSQFVESVSREQFEYEHRRRTTMPVELMEAVGGANVTSSSSDRLVAVEDAALVAAAKTGDAHAFELLVHRHEGRIFLLAQRMTRNREDAEDVVQQSFQKAFIHLRKFAGESLFSTWLTRIAINEALMLLRRRRGSRELSIDDSIAGEEVLFALEIPDSGQSPEDNYSQRERQRILSAALNELPHRTRRAIQLRELD